MPVKPASAKTPPRPSATPTQPAKHAKSTTSKLTAAPRQPTRDEAAALRAFERAHREFSRGNFSEARSLFVSLIDQFSGASEVAARARTYLTIAESRLRTDNGLPRDADSLYDRGVIELNRGEFVAAQEMFERALKREPEAAHIHYGLAATRARLGSIEHALTSLERAIGLQPNLRVRAQHDLDLTALRNEPDFERLVFSPR
ncbi:MAG TPA: tetratricopeptide repeat protein [Pyrinomonadaceae bacterium]|jgi:tetratricopeptide (TPR) repeat protein|nr:tetratricopeptide repeat protein [Pyrinomonadaceae bacterium]